VNGLYSGYMRPSNAALSALLVAVALVAATLVVQTAPGQGGRGAAPPPEPQHGHPSGQLVIWGD
jgi:hypothetical protein